MDVADGRVREPSRGALDTRHQPLDFLFLDFFFFSFKFLIIAESWTGAKKKHTHQHSHKVNSYWKRKRCWRQSFRLVSPSRLERATFVSVYLFLSRQKMKERVCECDVVLCFAWAFDEKQSLFLSFDIYIYIFKFYLSSSPGEMMVWHCFFFSINPVYLFSLGCVVMLYNSVFFFFLSTALMFYFFLKNYRQVVFFFRFESSHFPFPFVAISST